MNKTLEAFARSQLIGMLNTLSPDHKRIFKLMYGKRGTPDRPDADTTAKIEAMEISEVVAEMSADKLDWAMTQVENTLKRGTGG